MSGSRRPEPPLEILERMRHPVPMEEREDAEARRRAAIDSIAFAIRDGGPRRLRGARWLLFGAAAAAVLSGSAGWFFHAPPHPELRNPVPTAASPAAGEGELRVLQGAVVTTRGDLAATVSAGGAARVAEGDEVASRADSEAKLVLPRGVRVTVGASTQVSLVKVLAGEQRLRLALGRTEISVPRPGGPGVFSVDTPDSEVVVHGTEFSVLVEHDEETAATVTTVSVTRGSVFVTHAGVRRLVEVGTTWSSRADRLAAPAASERSGAGSTEPVNGGARRGAKAAATPTLAEQNRLFQAFLDARDDGDDVRALRLLDELLTRFPDTPLADQARLARFRTLQRLGRPTHGSP